MTSRRELADADGRRAVERSLDETLFVEAGAGSGKTTTLVTRIVNLVRNGVPISRIAAITFTEAAASELRVRIRRALIDRGENDRDRGLIEAAADVESAAITTLHGFARRLLADHPIEAALPPGFGVADEITSALAFQHAWSGFVQCLTNDDSHLELFTRAAALGIRLADFSPVAQAFDDNWDLLETVTDAKPLKPLNLDAAFDELDRFCAMLSGCRFPDEDKLALALDDLAVTVTAARSQPAIDQLRYLSQDLKLPARNIGRKDNWSEPSVADVRSEIVALRPRLEKTVDHIQHAVLSQFICQVADFVAGRVRNRIELGELAFHDLLVLARRLLRCNPTVRRQLHQRFSRILLDEFQDTDPIQIELAVLLATEKNNIDGSWTELASELPDGQLVVVGDPKQSIYRFRRADMAIYDATKSTLVDTPQRLTTNFRSVPGVVDWVNEVFGSLMGDGTPGEQPSYTPLVAHRSPNFSVSSPVTVFGGPSDEPVAKIRQAESADVAALICAAIDQGWETERDGRWEPLQLNDIAILVPSRLTLPALEAALRDANIPYRPETSSLVYATQEVADVLACVRAVANPTSEIDVVSVLRSPVFGVGDADLARWVADGYRWDYRTEVEEDQPVAEALCVLRRWHDQRWWLTPVDLVEQIIVDRRLREQALGSLRVRDRWRRYRFLIDQAEQFSASTGGNLDDFVTWAEAQASETARVTEPIPVEIDDDSVRILTIHGSKGLEFPFVIVAGAPTIANGRRARVQALFPPDAAPQVKVGKDRTTPDFSVYASMEDTLDASERIRLDYVAATRARDLLAVSVHHKSTGRGSSGKRLWTEHSKMVRPADVFTRPEQFQLAASPTEQLTLPADTYEVDRAHQARTLAAIAEEASGHGRWNVTQLASAIARRKADARCPETDIDQVNPADAEPIGGVGAVPSTEDQLRPTAIGAAVHQILATIDRFSPVGVEKAVRSACGRFDSADQETVRQLALAALESPTVKSAAEVDSWRELYVSMPLPDGSTLEGYIDLCFQTPNGFVVADYKTMSTRPIDQRPAVSDQVRYQLGLYAWLVNHHTDELLHNATIVYVARDGSEDVTVSNLGQLVTEIQRVVADGGLQG